MWKQSQQPETDRLPMLCSVKMQLVCLPIGLLHGGGGGVVVAVGCGWETNPPQPQRLTPSPTPLWHRLGLFSDRLSRPFLASTLHHPSPLTADFGKRSRLWELGGCGKTWSVGADERYGILRVCYRGHGAPCSVVKLHPSTGVLLHI